MKILKNKKFIGLIFLLVFLAFFFFRKLNAANGTYIFESDIVIAKTQVDLVIKGDKGSMTASSSFLGYSDSNSNSTLQVKVNQMKKTIDGDNIHLKYEKMGDDIRMTSESTKAFQNAIFKKVSNETQLAPTNTTNLNRKKENKANKEKKKNSKVQSKSSSEDSSQKTESSTESITKSSEVYSEFGNASNARWNKNKASELADLMLSWSKSMNQEGYLETSGTNNQGKLYWNADSNNAIDATVSATGQSNSEYTIVATYEYFRDTNLRHRYHFAIKKDGTPVIFYSQNGRNLNYSGLGFDYNIEKETQNADLKTGFAKIVSE